MNPEDAKRLYVKVDSSTEIFSRPEDTSSRPIEFIELVNKLSQSLSELSALDNSEKLREDAIRNGKAIIKNWQPLSDEQIDRILFNMREELAARGA